MEKYLKDDEIMGILEKYIDMNKKTEYAVLIDGEWGSGKTYFINHVFIKYLEKKEIEFSKISLYGVTSKKEIDDKITESILEKSHPKFGKLLAVTFNNIDTISDLASKVIPKPVQEVIGNIDVKNLLSKLQDIDNHIIIFDDLERCNLEINVILGYINEYIENKNNKVIIVANQKEISKSKKMNNLELKYLAVRPYNKQIYSQCEKNKFQYDNILNKDKNIQEDGIEKSILDKRVLELFSEDIMYKEIKEKVIGKEIYYLPNVEQICKELSKNSSNDCCKKILNDNAEEISKIMMNEKHNNIRTLKLVIEKFEEIMIGLEQYNIKKDKDYEKIFTAILLYLLKAYILKKKEDKIYEWNGNAEYDLKYSAQAKFRFVDDMILTEKINYEKVDKCLEEYSKEIKSQIESNAKDPVFILKNYYWEFEDNEIKQYTQKIYEKLENQEYDISSYPKIIYVLLNIKKLELKDFNFDKYFNLMQNNISNNKDTLKNEVFYKGFNIQSREVLEEYKEKIKELENILEITINTRITEDINTIINGDSGWSDNLNSYLNNISVNKFKLFLEIDIENLILVFKKSKTKDICNFRYIILNRDIFLEEVKQVELLINKLDDLIREENRCTQKYNFQLLKDNLIEKLNYIN